MHTYCVNRNAQPVSNDHEVHDIDSGCFYLPATANQIILGQFNSCQSAVAAAKNYFSDSNGCYWCANACHTT